MGRPEETYVYILRCSDSSYSTGVTTDLHKRTGLHNQGEAAAYTRTRAPVELVWRETYDTLKAAMIRESQFKGWSKAKKEALTVGKTAELERLSRCRSIHKRQLTSQ
jgi:predicted GIY-YIG superfamily endonuclease